MTEQSRSGLAEILGFSGTLEIADIGAAHLGEAPPYKPLLDLGIGHLNAFDADVRQHDRLRAVYGPGLSLFTDILGDGTPQTLHLATPGSGMTSLLKPSQKHLEFFNEFKKLGAIHSREPVTTRRLDDVAGLPDLQGGELAVLRHGLQRLRRCAMIQLEVSFVPLYEGQPTFGEVDVWMRAQGYLPHCFTDVKRWSISPVTRENNIRIPFNQLLEADIVYAKNPVEPEAHDADTLRKMALIAHHCYRSIDLAGRLIVHLQKTGDVAADSMARYMALVNTPAG
jgi:Methyltransferase FkbM domain